MTTTPRNFGKKNGQLIKLDTASFLPLPPPYDKLELEHQKIRSLANEQTARYECELDGVSAVMFPKPETETQKRELARKIPLRVEEAI